MIDALLVRYCPTAEATAAFEATVKALHRDPQVRALVHDNTDNNIGLSRARNLLLKEATGDAVILMDFDLSWDYLNFNMMALKALQPTVGLVVPRSPGFEHLPDPVWQPISRCACHFMVVAREKLLKFGGIDERYFVAYGDWDLLSRMRSRGLALLQHNSSRITAHTGSARTPQKREVWHHDRAIYDRAWPGKNWS
jgi:GT2 family glycosyltransferase